MTDYIILTIALLGAINLITLSIIDLRHWILPDWLNATFAILGIAFHWVLGFSMLEPPMLVAGAAVGGGILYVVRAVGNWHYKQDTLGLGDVKLLAAAGIWLGPEDVIIAMTIGAFAGLMHGIGAGLATAIREKAKPDFHRLMIPAGPGFCIGIFAACLWKYWALLA